MNHHHLIWIGRQRPCKHVIRILLLRSISNARQTQHDYITIWQERRNVGTFCGFKHTCKHSTAPRPFTIVKLHTRCGIVIFVLPRFETVHYGKHSVSDFDTVTLYYRVLKLYVMASTLLDIAGRSHGQSVPTIKEIRPVSLFFLNKIRKLNHADLVINNSNCCNLCSQ